MDRLLRIQDREGRGPYRPGSSWRWTDPEWPAENCPPWWTELGQSAVRIAYAKMTHDLHYGCGFRTHEQLHNWFSPRELSSLDRLGFALVTVLPVDIIAETPRQVVFGTIAPLSLAPRIKLTSKLARAA